MRPADSMASGDWSRQEVEAIVADHLAMLAAELSEAPYSKAEHRRRLLPLLRARSEQSVEFKHCNISAILIELGFPYISGYKPRTNYQALLHDVVSARLAGQSEIVMLAAADADRPIVVPAVDDILMALTEPPRHSATQRATSERPTPYVARAPRPPVNYLEREARNTLLGRTGEDFVVHFEQARLMRAGQERLATKIEHVALARGDGDGFDVLSYEESGTERFIEVKTTKYGRETPFFVSRNEVAVSENHPDRYHLYRVFEFRAAPRLFTLHGALSDTCALKEMSYVATVA